MSIEERAKIRYGAIVCGEIVSYQKERESDYVEGATVQRYIDIEKACRWLADFLCETRMDHTTIESLREAMMKEE